MVDFLVHLGQRGLLTRVIVRRMKSISWGTAAVLISGVVVAAGIALAVRRSHPLTAGMLIVVASVALGGLRGSVVLALPRPSRMWQRSSPTRFQWLCSCASLSVGSKSAGRGGS